MRRHPELGAKILSGSELDDIRGWVMKHHERPDGKGYPEGLDGRARFRSRLRSSPSATPTRR